MSAAAESRRAEARHCVLATCAAAPDITADDRLLATALERRGISTSGRPWSDASFDWSRVDAVVVRSVWDYHRRPDEYRSWLAQLERAGVAVHNPTALQRWNLHKGYLRELAARGFPVVPTDWLAAGEHGVLREILRTRQWARAVVKPAISLSADRTWRCTPETAAEVVASMHAAGDRDWMVQPYLEEIETEGEWSLVYFAGEFSHSVRKTPARGDFRVQGEHGGTVHTELSPAAARRAADAIVAHAAPAAAFARVDGVHAGGRFLLMELEVIDPELFLHRSTGAAERMAAAVSAF